MASLPVDTQVFAVVENDAPICKSDLLTLQEN